MAAKSKFLGKLDKGPPQKVVDELDGLVELATAENAVKEIVDGVRDGRFAAGAPEENRRDFVSRFDKALRGG